MRRGSRVTRPVRLDNLGLWGATVASLVSAHDRGAATPLRCTAVRRR